MKDIHSHILNGIDDGSKTFEESISILKDLENVGVTSLVATPHYIIGSKYNSNNKDKRKLIAKIQKKTNIKIYMGNEVFLDNDILEYIKNKEISTINNSRYLLIEFPLAKKLHYANEIIFALRSEGIVPIIAHIERYHYLDFKDYKYFLDAGCIFQANLTSLLGKYGNQAKKRLIKLLKNNYIQIIGTDIHHNLDYDFKEALDILDKIVKKETFLELTENNFDRIINDEAIKVSINEKKIAWFRKKKNENN